MLDSSINFKIKQNYFSKHTIEEINLLQDKLEYIPSKEFRDSLDKIFDFFKNENQVTDPKDIYNFHGTN